MSRHQVGVGQLGKCRAEMNAQRRKKRVRQFHTAIFVPKKGFASIRWIRFTPKVAGVDHPIDEVGDRGR
jgi:hypothetical protein